MSKADRPEKSLTSAERRVSTQFQEAHLGQRDTAFVLLRQAVDHVCRPRMIQASMQIPTHARRSLVHILGKVRMISNKCRLC